MRAAVYARKSTAPKGRELRSIDEQVADALADCERRGWEVVEIFREANRSASRYATRDREEFARLVEGVEAGRFDVIVAWEASRFVRDTKVYADLADTCIRTSTRYSYNGRVLDLSDPDDAFNAGLDALLSEREAGITRKRILRTHRFNAEAGIPHGQIPYGYRRVYDDKTGALLRQEPDPTEGPVVSEIFTRVAGGESMRSVCRSLTERSIPTPGGETVWTTAILRHVLRRQGYLGKRIWNGQVMPNGGWEPLVDESTFDRVQSRLQDPGRRIQHTEERIKHLLSGIVVCGECSSTMHCGPRNSVPSYICRDGHVARAKGLIDPALEELVLLRLEDPAIETAARGDDPEVARLLDDVQRIEREIGSLVASVESGDLTARMASAEERRLTADLQALQAKVKQKAPLPEVVLRVAGPGARERWGRMTLTQQRAVIRALFSSLRVLRKKGQTEIGRHHPGVVLRWTGDEQEYLLPPA